MKIFVTGATGYIGAALTKQLLASGHTVHALVRSPEKLRHLNHPAIVPFKGDLRDLDVIRKAMQGCEQVYHVAAYAKVWARDSGLFYEMNVKATEDILRLAGEINVRKIVYTSTAGVYGASIKGIVNEEKVRDIDFFNEYEGSKAMSELKVKDAVIQRGMDIVTVSPTRVYGPSVNGDTSSVSKIIEDFYNGKWRVLLGDGEKKGNYVYIDDVVDGHIAAMEKGRTGHTYILGGPNHTYHDFFAILKVKTGIHRKLFRLPVWLMWLSAFMMLQRARFFGTEPLVTPKWIAKVKYDWEVSVLKMEQELGIHSRSLEVGIQQTIDWLKAGKT